MKKALTALLTIATLTAAVPASANLAGWLQTYVDNGAASSDWHKLNEQVETLDHLEKYRSSYTIKNKGGFNVTVYAPQDLRADGFNESPFDYVTITSGMEATFYGDIAIRLDCANYGFNKVPIVESDGHVAISAHGSCVDPLLNPARFHKDGVRPLPTLYSPSVNIHWIAPAGQLRLAGTTDSFGSL